MPQARREHGLRAIAKARDALAVKAREGQDPRISAAAGRSRGEANAEHHRRNREWSRNNGKGTRDRA
ncbi:MAG: hypothetical protein ABI231_02755 [Candidatus Tumulicola sp.]